MQDKIKYMLLFAILAICFKGEIVDAYTGKGTADNPYVVSSESDIAKVFELDKKESQWTYIAVDDVIAFTKTHVVDFGKYRIYAIGNNQTIRRSKKMTATVNSESNPKFCLKVRDGAAVVFGYSAGSNYKLVIDGVKGEFRDQRECNGWMHVESYSEIVIDTNCIVKDAMNTVVDDESAPIRVSGTLTVNGEIKNCNGINGGAIKTKGGSVYINATANIHDCESQTEGGAIFSETGSLLRISGGTIRDCESVEEGGAICSVYSRLEILSGNIIGNQAGTTGGGVFSGKQDVLIIGARNKTGPNINKNFAHGSGGGVRCNGGYGGVSGGLSNFYSGNICENSTATHGGGISCGEESRLSKSQINIEGMNISNNYAYSSGGGIWMDSTAKGILHDYIGISNTTIANNISQSYGGGILVNSSVVLNNVNIKSNVSKASGGGMFINQSGRVKISNGVVEGNTGTNLGSGIYLKGKLEIENDAVINSNNKVFLEGNTYIDVVGKLNAKSGYVACIQVAARTNGRKVVRANYVGTSGEKELYYNASAEDEYFNDNLEKRYKVESLGNNQCLRPTEKVEGIEAKWIIISQKYKIEYKGNADGVKNVPDASVKFWNENIKISTQEPSRPGYMIAEKHWNTKNNGSGVVYKPGSLYAENKDITLYAIWEIIELESLKIMAADRFYVVNQKITLAEAEILKYVKVEDEPQTGYPYKLRIVSIRNSKGVILTNGVKNIVSEKYMNTRKVEHYKVVLYTEDAIGKRFAKKTMNVYIMDNPNNEANIRFVSKEYFNTVSPSSKWFRQLKKELKESLNKDDKNFIYEIDLSEINIKKVNKLLKNDRYKFTSQVRNYIKEHLKGGQ